MGRDKAFLTIKGTSLVARQTALLRSLGIDDLLISGRAGVEYRVPNVRIVTDHVADAGPLAGLAAVLASAIHPWVLVLAVDLPHVPAPYLRSIVHAAMAGAGIVPHGPNGYEPLVALYPRALLPNIETALQEERLSLQALLHTAVCQGVMQRIEIKASERPFFINWNTPEDIRPTH
jgi:molybdopterin-guanine dinucleotide biosynthesis protein A